MFAFVSTKAKKSTIYIPSRVEDFEFSKIFVDLTLTYNKKNYHYDIDFRFIMISNYFVRTI